MPGTRMNAGLPPARSRRSSTAASSASRPATVPAMAYCEPRRLKLTIWMNSPAALGEAGDEVGDVVVGQLALRGADRGEAVVAATVRVAGNQVVHRHAAAEHDLQQRLERQDAGDRGERVVLADRVAARDRVLAKTPASRISATWATASVAIATWVNWVRNSTPSGWRCSSPSAHRSVGLSRTTARIEKPRASRVCLSARSQTSRAAAERRVGLEAHALALDALAGEGVRRARSSDDGLGDHRQLAVGAGGDLDDGVAAEDAGALDGDLHLGAGLQRRDPAGQPAADAGGGGAWRRTEAAARWATAESHMPCTIGPSNPASRAAGTSVCSGLWSPLTAAKAAMWCGAVR